MEDLDGHSPLLARWCEGDSEALGLLIKKHLPWIRGYLHRRLSDVVRSQGDTSDFASMTAQQLLGYCPPRGVSCERQFRALLARVMENLIREKYAHATAKRRRADRQVPLDQNFPPAADGSSQSPSRIAMRNEEAEMVELAKRLLPTKAYLVLQESLADGLDFQKIGHKQGIPAGTARKRYDRAVVKTAAILTALQNGAFGELLRDNDEEED